VKGNYRDPCRWASPNPEHRQAAKATRQGLRYVVCGRGSAAAQLYDPLLVNAFNDVTTNDGSWDRGIAESPQHDRLDLGRGHVEDCISDVIARKDSSDLSAIGTPPRIVHGDAFATAGIGRQRSSREQRDRRRRDNEMVKSLHALAFTSLPPPILTSETQAQPQP
jgi:hypothetical protein